MSAPLTVGLGDPVQADRGQHEEGGGGHQGDHQHGGEEPIAQSPPGIEQGQRQPRTPHSHLIGPSRHGQLRDETRVYGRPSGPENAPIGQREGWGRRPVTPDPRSTLPRLRWPGRRVDERPRGAALKSRLREKLRCRREWPAMKDIAELALDVAVVQRGELRRLPGGPAGHPGPLRQGRQLRRGLLLRGRGRGHPRHRRRSLGVRGRRPPRLGQPRARPPGPPAGSPARPRGCAARRFGWPPPGRGGRSTGPRSVAILSRSASRRRWTC